VAHNAPPFCKYYRMQPRQHYASEWIFFIMFSSICLVDFLLHRVWIILHWNVDQHLGYSGLITLPEVSNHFKHIHPKLFECHDYCTNYLLTISLVTIQQVYMYFRGSGKAAEMKREAARGALRAAIWFISLVEKPVWIPYAWISVVYYKPPQQLWTKLFHWA